jgi:hypothetical protein
MGKTVAELVAGDRVVIGDMVVVTDEVVEDEGYVKLLTVCGAVVWLNEMMTYFVVG